MKAPSGWADGSAEPPAVRPRIDRVLLAAIGLIAASHLAFVGFDFANYTYDDGWYAESALHLQKAWMLEGLPGAYRYFVRDAFGGIKAPFILVPPQLFLLILGRHDSTFLVTNVFGLVVAMSYLGALARTFVGRWPAVMAVSAFGLMPLTADMTRQFFVEIWLTAVVLMFVYHVVRAEGFTRRGHSLLAGLAVGIGLVTKITFPLFIVGVAVMEFIRAVRRGNERVWAAVAMVAAALAGPGLAFAGAQRDFTRAGVGAGLAVSAIAIATQWRRSAWRFNLACALSLGFWMAAPWYMHNGATIVRFAASASFGEYSMNYGAADLLSLDAITAYWVNNVNVGFGAVFAVAAGAAAVLALLMRLISRAPADSAALCRRGLGVAAAWILPAVIMFTLGRNRTTRFLLPVLPGLALFYAVLLRCIANRVRVMAAGVGVAHALAAGVVYYVFTVGGPGRYFGPGNRFLLCGPEMTTEGVVERQGNPLVDVVRATQRVLRADWDRMGLAMLLSDTVWVNNNTLSYAATKLDVNITFGLAPYGVTLDEAIKALDRADVLVWQEGGRERDFPDFTNQNAREILARIMDGRIRGWRLLPEPHVLLPDGGTMRFFQRDAREAADGRT